MEKNNNCPCTDICPLETAMAIIGGKWKVQILCSLYQDGVTRFNSLKRKLKGISNTMLTNALKELENDGLVIREQFMEMPVRVEYRASILCDELMPILQQYAQWGMKIRSYV